MDQVEVLSKGRSVGSLAGPGWLAKMRGWLTPSWGRSKSPSPAALAAPAFRDSLHVGISATGILPRSAWGDEAMRGVFAKEGEERRIVSLASGTPLTAQLKAEFDRGWSLIDVQAPLRGPLPAIRGRTRVFLSIRPEKLILDEDLVVTYTNPERGTVRVAAVVEDAGDLVLVSAFVGNMNCFPTPPDQASGLSGRALSAQAVGNGVRWPTVNAGLDVCMELAIKPTVLDRIQPPEGYAREDLSLVEVHACLNLFGLALR